MKKKDIYNFSLSDDELRELIEMIPASQQKTFFKKLREKLPKVPDWMSFEEHVETARLHIKNDLIKGATSRENESEFDQKHEK